MKFCFSCNIPGEFQPVIIGIEAGVATETAKRRGDDGGGEIVLHSDCQDWRVTQYKGELSAFLHLKAFWKNVLRRTQQDDVRPLVVSA